MLDQDSSGFITYDELTNAYRQKCKKTEKVIAQSTIKSLWCALDADCSNTLEKSEMGNFLRAGADSLPKAPPPQKREYKLISEIDRVGMGRALDSTPTSELLKELEAEGITPPDADELLELSKQLCGWLEQYRKIVLDENSAPTWFNLCAALRYSNKRSLLCFCCRCCPSRYS